ncbi:segregation and condensation protein A [Fructobacillus ficulneus]|uniref:Segregation and condensation protein A n=1 Tax=Fructobacillus ficulneus TaxID=157463 RepID=A0A0K8MK42_9LACO|nr:segregation and condensation protein A [Fructobacillus ficulneus]
MLLHLIKKHEMDIFQLPIAEVTKQYLSFIHDQQAMQLDVAAEYLVMAAKLIHLKSTDLLPKAPVEEDADDDFEELDPKEELINRLLVYQRFQQATGFFHDRQEADLQSYVRPAVADSQAHEDQVLELAPGLTLIDLQLAFDNVLARKRDLAPRIRQVASDSFTIADGIATIHDRLQTLGKEESLPFSALFDHIDQVDQLVMTFLGLLEITKAGEITLWQADLTEQILIKVVDHESNH